MGYSALSWLEKKNNQDRYVLHWRMNYVEVYLIMQQGV